MHVSDVQFNISSRKAPAKNPQCDGASPCSRCRADNAICVFGERKKSHDKVYPKGYVLPKLRVPIAVLIAYYAGHRYVEMLEQQQTQLVNAIRDMYQRLLSGDVWVGSPLKQAPNGYPLTHDILEQLGVLKIDGTDDGESFEDDFETLQQKAYNQEHDIMSPRSSNADSCPPSKRASRNPTFPTRESTLPAVQFPPTPPDQSPTEPPTATFDTPFGPDTPMNLDPLSLPASQTWFQAPPDCDTEMDFLNVDISAYNNLGLLEQKVNPCLSMSNFNDDDLRNFGMTGMLS